MRSAPGSRRFVAVAVLAVLVIAPLAAMMTAGADDDMPLYGYPFTYSEEDEDYPTLFIGPDRVPLATWEDESGRLHLSRLSITEPSKPGIPLSNLPRALPAEIDGHVDVLAMDASGILHVVWEDGKGGVWHKTYDDEANVVVNNNRLSSSDAHASAPAIAATVSEEGAAAWVAWIESRDRVGTHVRLASIDGSGNILRSNFVDGITSDMDPTACDVFLDLDEQPHVVFIADDGHYWAVSNGAGGYDLNLVHDGQNTSLPLVIPVPGGPLYAMFETGERVYTRRMTENGLEPRVHVFGNEWKLTSGWNIRATDLATVLNSGYLAVAAWDPVHVTYYAAEDGTIAADYPVIWPGHMMPPTDGDGLTVLSIAADDRGQAYGAHAISYYSEDNLDCHFWLIDRAPDVALTRSAGTDPLEPIMIRPGSTLDVSVRVDSQVGYDHDLELEIAQGLEPPLVAEVLQEGPIEMDGGSSTRVTVRLSASMTAGPGSEFTVTLNAAPSGWPDAVTSLDLHVEVPEYQPFIVRAPDEPVAALPGLAVPVTFTVESWSDSDETITLTPSAPKGWTVETEETRSLPAGETIEVDLMVTAPEGAAEGTAAEVLLEGVTGTGEAGAGAHVPAVVGARTGVVMDVGEDTLGVLPGSAVETTMAAARETTVRNTGNEPVTVSFHATVNRDGWRAWTTPASMTLTPGSEALLGVKVGAPEGALWGAGAQVMVVAAVADGPTLDVAYLPCTVQHVTGYFPYFLPNSAPLMKGRAQVGLLLENEGNGFEDVTVELTDVPPGWTADIADPSGEIRIAPGGSRTLKVTVTAPPGTPPGEEVIVARMWGSEGPRTALLRVHVPEVFSVDLQADEEARTLTPPGTVVFPFTMVSTGNALGEARVSIEGLPVGWDYAFTTPDGEAAVSFPMDVGDTERAHLSLRVPGDATGDTEALDLVVRDRHGELLSRVPIYVRLRLPDLTVVDMVLLPAEPREGAPMTVRATVINLGMADAEDVSVVLKDGTTVIDRDTLSIVPRAGQLEVVLYMVPQSGRRTLVLEVDPADAIRERSEANNVVKRHVDVAAPEEEPLVTPAVAQASVAAVVTLSILGLLGGTESGKYAFLTLIFIPLYTKIKKDRVLDHYLRGKIHGYIIANPGEHYNAIKEQLNVTNGALSYHLRVLEREGYVRSRMDGIFKRFYPSDMKLPTTQRNISSFQEVILTIVKNNQGLSQKDIAKRIGASSQVINYHVKILEESDLIRVDRTRRKSRVYAIETPAPAAAAD